MASSNNFIEGEDYMGDFQFIDNFSALSKKYKMGCEFKHLGGVDFKPIKQTPVIYCYGGKVAIYPKDNEICCAHIMSSINFEKRFKDIGVKMVLQEEVMSDGSISEQYQWGDKGEFILEFYIKDLGKVVDVFKIKPANKTAQNPHSIRNLHEYLRFQRNIDKRYGDILNQRILENRE
ncbi:MAG: hypothetical protein ACRC6B_06460 [Fusobacteriaceae bacterium]